MEKVCTKKGGRHEKEKEKKCVLERGTPEFDRCFRISIKDRRCRRLAWHGESD